MMMMMMGVHLVRSGVVSVYLPGKVVTTDYILLPEKLGNVALYRMDVAQNALYLL